MACWTDRPRLYQLCAPAKPLAHEPKPPQPQKATSSHLSHPCHQPTHPPTNLRLVRPRQLGLCPWLRCQATATHARRLRSQVRASLSRRFCHLCAHGSRGVCSCAGLRANLRRESRTWAQIVASTGLSVAGHAFDPRISGLWAHRSSHCATSLCSNRRRTPVSECAADRQ